MKKRSFDVEKFKNSKEYSKLSEKERTILEMKFQDKMTYKEIAEKFGITTMRVMQIVERSLDDIERMLKARDYPNALDIPIVYSTMPKRIRNHFYKLTSYYEYYHNKDKTQFTLSHLKELIETGKIYKARNIGVKAIKEAVDVFAEDYNIEVNVKEV